MPWANYYDNVSESDLLEANSYCEWICELGSRLAYSIHFGIEEVLDELMPVTEWDHPLSLGQESATSIFRRDYILDSQPDSLWRAKLELDAASEGVVLITETHDGSNWHESVCRFYILLLNDLWENVLGSDRYSELESAREADDFDKAMELMGPPDVKRLVAVAEPLKQSLARFSFKHRIASSQLQREIARVFQNRSARNNRSLLISRADNKKEDFATLPASADVRDLCQLLNRNRDRIQGRQLNPIDIARKFTREPLGNDPKAQSLLRQARRFPHLWKPRQD